MPDLNNTEPLRSFDKVSVFLIRALTGDGTEESPSRITETWITERGDVVVYRDRWKEDRDAQERGDGRRLAEVFERPWDGAFHVSPAPSHAPDYEAGEVGDYQP